jgi:hypothetical protein
MFVLRALLAFALWTTYLLVGVGFVLGILTTLATQRLKAWVEKQPKQEARPVVVFKWDPDFLRSTLSHFHSDQRKES